MCLSHGAALRNLMGFAKLNSFSSKTDLKLFGHSVSIQEVLWSWKEAQEHCSIFPNSFLSTPRFVISQAMASFKHCFDLKHSMMRRAVPFTAAQLGGHLILDICVCAKIGFSKINGIPYYSAETQQSKNIKVSYKYKCVSRCLSGNVLVH